MPAGTVEAANWLPADGDRERLKERYGFAAPAARAECLRLAGPRAGLRVLDIGTGSGLMAAALSVSRALVTSLDIKFQTIVGARDRLSSTAADTASRSRLVVANALHLPFRADSFDAVVSFDSMHHMADCGAATEEMERVLKPGGRLVMADLNPHGLAAIRSLSAERGEPHQENGCRLKSQRRILRSDGTQVDRHDYAFVSVFSKQKHQTTFPNTWAPLAAWTTYVEESKQDSE